MAAQLEDAVIKVKVDTGSAREELKKIDQEEEKLREATEKQKEKTQEEAEKAKSVVANAIAAITGQILPHPITSITQLPQIAAGLIPIAGPALQSGLRLEELLSEKGAPFVSGIAKKLLGDDTFLAAIEDSAMARFAFNLGMSLSDLRLKLQSLEQSTEAALNVGKAAALLDIGVSAEWIENFWSASEKFNYMQAEMNRYGRQKGYEAAGKMFADVLKRIF